MKQVIVRNKLTQQVTHGATSDQFPSEQEMMDWVDQTSAAGSWGLPERPEFDEMGEPTGQTLEAEFEVEILDITAQVEQEKINAEALAYLAATDWMAIREFEGGTAMPAEIKAERSAARARVVR